MTDATRSTGAADLARDAALATGRLPVTTIVADERAGTTIAVNPDDASGEFTIPWSVYSLKGLRQWAISEAFPKRGRISFSSDGLVIDMSPETFETHNDVKTDVGAEFNRLVRRRKLEWFIGDRGLSFQ